MKENKALWLTDLHLSHLGRKDREEFIQSLKNVSPDCLLIGGDTGEAHSICNYLQELENVVSCPVYFVLGNHDFYGGSLSVVRANVRRIVKGSNNLHFLDDMPPIELSNDTALVGHSGWADGRLGNYRDSRVELNDYVLIEEFKRLNKDKRLKKLNELGDSAALQLEQKLTAAFDDYNRVLCLTHVPPFKESCWHEGKISDDYWLPHFTWKAAGDVMRKVMQARPDSYLKVLCGHTHSSGKVRILENLEVVTASAEYGRPRVEEVICLR